ncbi:hypothetical protein J2T13_005128 [Paenibacillus sp. DS2015]|uniref:hypothetical protein n=1 Tax=Paenibacillus sp. DS2015 TaxID=3373917 RepID=UPI003D232709
MKKLYEYAKSLTGRLFKRELTSDDKVALTSIILCIIVVCTLLATIKYWGVPLLAIGFVSYLFYDKYKEGQVQSNTAPIDYIVYKCLYHVVCQIHDRIGARKPLDLHDISAPVPCIMKNGLPMIQANIPKAHNSPLSPEELSLIRKHLMARIEAHLRDGNVEGIPYASLNGDCPIILIENISDEYSHFTVTLLFVDNQRKLEYAYSKMKRKPTTDIPTSMNDKDF